MTELTREGLHTLREETRQDFYQTGGKEVKTQIIVGMGTCGIAAGSRDVLRVFREEAESRGMGDLLIKQSGCMGMCHAEPTIEIKKPDMPDVIYGCVSPELAGKIVRKHLLGGELIEDHLLERGSEDILRNTELSEKEEAGIPRKQYRVVLRNCGIIDPDDINEYIARDGYCALERAIFEMTPDDIIKELKKAGLRGRGGAGFPTWMKWNFSKLAEGETKYVVCNADEGDPGAYMDRSTLEGDPHSVLEAMTIAGKTIGAAQGYIYIRAEYPLAINRLNEAMRQSRELGLLGEDILGSGFDFDIEIRLGAGAFVCGEETALLASIEGDRGMPVPRPPFPSVKGLWGKPTVINNVETWANIPVIIQKGGEWFSRIGTEDSSGTKVFALTGKIKNSGLVEVPMGTTLREIVYDIGGGIPNGRKFKAVQTGGPSGGVITADYLDTPIDYTHLQELGSIMGSGGMIVMDEDDCMVDVAKFYLGFTVEESCGKCAPCRVGGRTLYNILEGITKGTGEPEDIDKLERIGHSMKKASLCGLGQTAPNPVLSTLRYFRDEYDGHIKQQTCIAKKCKGLITYHILADKCIGCTLCARHCPVNAIHGERRQVHTVDQSLCIKCGECFDSCKFNAVYIR